MFSNYFDALPQAFLDFKNQLNKNTIGFHVQCYENEIFPDIEQTDIALIVVPESRGSSFNLEQNETAYIDFRKGFYNLFRGSWKLRISDFGNLKCGMSLKDTYFALNDIVSSLLSQSVFPIVIGGTHDLVYPIYQSYESFTKGVNLLCVDSKFDLLDQDMSNINAHNFLGYIIKQQPNHLNNFVNLGYQSYLCQHDESNLLEKMFFDALH